MMSRILRVAALAESDTDRLPDEPAARGSELPENGRRLGSILKKLGKLDEGQVDFILQQQAHSPRAFGDVAIALGLVSAADVEQAQAELQAVRFQPPPSVTEGGLPQELLTLEDATSPQGEALRALRSQLMLRWFGPAIEQHTLAVLSPDGGDGRSHLCASLAVLIAQMEEDVLVLDADLRRPRMHRLFGVDNSVGLSGWLNSADGAPQVHGARGYEHLHVLPAGPTASHPNELLGRRRFGLLLEQLARRYSFILVDTPPAMQCAEALTIAVRSSGCLLLARRHRTRLADTREVADTLSKHGVSVVGGVINEY